MNKAIVYPNFSKLFPLLRLNCSFMHMSSSSVYKSCIALGSIPRVEWSTLLPVWLVNIGIGLFRGEPQPVVTSFCEPDLGFYNLS